MNLVLRIDGAAPFLISAIDDRGAGGNSTTSVSRDSGRIDWQCDIGLKYEWPFCELAANIAPLPNGFDFSRYDMVAIKMDIVGEGSRRMRLFMRHFEKGFADPNNQLTWKQNELQFDPAENGKILLLRLNALNVASWWLTNNHIPVERAAVQISSVPTIQLSTSGIHEARSQKISIDYIEFRGKLLTRGEMALIVASIWLAAGTLFLMIDFQQRRQALATAQRRQFQLEELNHALTIENERVGTLARLDPLTGSLNRAGIRDLLWEETTQPNAHKHQLSLLCCDLDHFKRINDGFGHSAGDDTLVAFAQLIQRNVRNSDYLVRWGGEEFFLFCKDTQTEAAAGLAEKLRKAVESHHWPHDLTVTMSVGVATLGKHETLPQFLARADAALYRAKDNGRNRVELAAPHTGRA